MDTLSISDLVGSSQYEAVADDSLKDEDNAAWVMTLEPYVRAEWIERISWIRLVDRLAENELVHQGSSEFHKFQAGWQKLLVTGCISTNCAYRETLTSICNRWLNPYSELGDRLSIQSWERFLEATAAYHQPNLTIDTIAQYTTMLEELSGSCFQILPFLQEKYWEAAHAFGAVDQFFNNLRDMREDAEQGICYLPTELLEKFGISRSEILQLTACQNLNYWAMMQFWLEEYLPELYQKTSSLLEAEDLHPSWQIWRDWSFYRYRRIEQIFRSCNFDYVQFPEVYWAEVRRDLPILLAKVKSNQQCPVKLLPHQSLQSQEELALPSVLLELGNKFANATEFVMNVFQWRDDRVQSGELC